MEGGLLLPSNLDEGVCLDFNGSSQYVNVGNAATSIKSVAFWICPDSISSKGLIELSSGNRIDIGSSVISTTGLATVVTYVNGIATTALTVSVWQHVVVTFTSAETASAVTLGLANSVYYDGKMDDVRFFADVLTAEEVQKVYSTGVNPATGPLNHWKFNAGSGTTATDSGSSPKDGTLTNSPTWTTTHNPFYVTRARATSTDLVTGLGATAINSLAYTIAKKPGGSIAKLQFSSDGSTFKNANGDDCSNTGGYSFDAVNDYAECVVANFRSGDSSGAISVWVNVTSRTTFPVIFFSSDVATTNRLFGFYLDGAGLLTVYQANGGAADTITAGPIPLNQLTHIVVVSTGTAWIVYVDGVSRALTVTAGSNSGDWFADTSNRDNITIGTVHDNTGPRNYFAGIIDDVRVFSQTLTADEVWDLFARNKQPYTPVGWWKLDGNGNDSSGAGNNLTISGATALTEFSSLPQFGEPISDDNDVLSFDGVNDIARSATANYRSGDSAGSIAAWIYRSGSGTRYSILSSCDEATNATYFFSFLLETTGELIIAQRNNDTATEYKTDAIVPVGAWTHVAVTSSGTEYILYINGVAQSATGTNDGDWFADTANRDSVTLGLFRTSESYAPFFGKIANVCVYSAALSAATILADFQNGYPSTTNLVNEWRMNEGAGNLTDSVGGLTMTVSGATWTKDLGRPQPTTPAQQTFNLAGLGLTSSFRYRSLFRSLNHDRAMGVDETTVDYTGGGGRLVNGGLVNRGLVNAGLL